MIDTDYYSMLLHSSYHKYLLNEHEFKTFLDPGIH